jgi:hypothetical protein
MVTSCSRNDRAGTACTDRSLWFLAADTAHNKVIRAHLKICHGHPGLQNTG